MTSCISPPESLDADQVEIEFAEVEWPVLVRGIRVYARRQPPQVQSELLRLGRLIEKAAAEPQSGGD